MSAEMGPKQRTGRATGRWSQNKFHMISTTEQLQPVKTAPTNDRPDCGP